MAPVGTHTSSGKPVSKARKPPTFNSIKSLPVGFRLTESIEGLEGSNGVFNDDGNFDGSEFVVEQVDQGNDDSPYGGTVVNEFDDDSNVVSSPLASAPSIAESKWNDTVSYAKKKVLC